MLFKVIYHQKALQDIWNLWSPYLWAAILIWETSSVVSGVMVSCDIKLASFFILSVLVFFPGQDNWTNLTILF